MAVPGCQVEGGCGGELGGQDGRVEPDEKIHLSVLGGRGGGVGQYELLHQTLLT